MTPERFDANNLTLHGLWPDLEGDVKHAYAYCGVDAAIKSLDKWMTRAQIPALPLSDDLFGRLKVHMPSVASSIEKHEWFAHGSCSGLTPQRYFEIAEGLVSHFQASTAGRYISAHVGGTMDSDVLLAEFEKDFGPGSRASVRLYCDKGTAKLAELQVDLKNDPGLSGGFAGALASRDDREPGNCPRILELVAPATR